MSQFISVLKLRSARIENYYFSGSAILFLIFCAIGFYGMGRYKMDHGIDLSTFRYFLHGVTGTLWLLVYLVQTQLIFRGNIRRHRRVGMFGVAALIILFFSTLYMLFTMPSAYPHRTIQELAPNIGIQASGTVISCLLITLGVIGRNNAFVHKRFMFYGSLLIAGAGIDRVPITFGAGPDTPGFILFGLSVKLLFMLPLLVKDLLIGTVRQKVYSFAIFLFPWVTFFLLEGVMKPQLFESDAWVGFVQQAFTLLYKT